MNLDKKSLFILELKRTSDLDPRYREEALARAEQQYIDEGGKVWLLQIARELRDSSPRPRRVVIATPARKVGEAKETYQAGGSTLGPPGLGRDRDRHMDI